jgi:hypothetical protein
MASSTDNVKLGVCYVLFDGVDLGYTKGGVEVEVSTKTHEVTVDQFGETPIGEIITGRMVSAKVPLAETTLENMLSVMPGSTLVSDGAKATGSVTFVTTAPANNDAVTINGYTFAFKTAPTGPYDLAIPASISAAATALANAINNSTLDVKATANAGAVTLVAHQRGTAGNYAITKVGSASITVVGLTGGVNVTKAKVVVSTGININLLSISKPLILRPKGTNGEDDFKIFAAATAGALSFTYNVDSERVYSTEFKGYVGANGNLFQIGNDAAV